jgi:hypothetical protein
MCRGFFRPAPQTSSTAYFRRRQPRCADQGVPVLAQIDEPLKSIEADRPISDLTVLRQR